MGETSAAPQGSPHRFERVMVTGHRPSGLNAAEAAWAQVALARTAHRLASAYQTRVAISGMALGADTWWALSALAAGLQLHAYIPFTEQSAKWSEADKRLWSLLRQHSSQEVLVGGHEYDVRHLHARNDAMLANCDLVVAVHKAGTTTGGTAATVKKARSRRLPILLLDPSTATITPEGWTPATP